MKTLLRKIIRKVRNKRAQVGREQPVHSDDVVKKEPSLQDIKQWLEANPVVEFKGAKSKSPLIVDNINRKGRFVRLSLQTTVSFHLDTIEIFNKAGRSIASGKNTIISSCYNDDPKYNGQGALKGKKNGGCGFHTKREKFPWLVIDLKTVRNLDKVIVYNREDHYFTRALSIKVESSRDLKKWDLLYDNWAPLKEFHQSEMTERAKALLHSAVLDAEPAIAYVNKLKKSGDLKAALAFHEEINELLKPKKLAMGPHGFTQTFEMRTKEAKDKTLSELSWLLKTLNDELNIPAFISSGTLLGVVRDNQLIPHDDDVDICYISQKNTDEDILQERNQIVAALTAKGCKVSHSGIAHYWCTTPRGQNIDLFTGFIRGDECFMNPIGSVPVANVLPLNKQLFQNHELSLPNNPEVLLELNYGTNWKNPDPLWSFNWKKAKEQFGFLYAKS